MEGNAFLVFVSMVITCVLSCDICMTMLLLMFVHGLASEFVAVPFLVVVRCRDHYTIIWPAFPLLVWSDTLCFVTPEAAPQLTMWQAWGEWKIMMPLDLCSCITIPTSMLNGAVM